MVESVGLFTADEFEIWTELPENAEGLFELIHGKIVEKLPTEVHGMLAANIARMLGNHVIPRKLGKVGVEVRYRKPADKYNTRMPDVSFRVSDAPPIEKGSVPHMLDLAVEIQSPDDKARDMREKASYYLQNGAKLVWLLYPSTQTIEVCTRDSQGELEVTAVEREGLITGGNALPDFTVSVAEIFAVL